MSGARPEPLNLVCNREGEDCHYGMEQYIRISTINDFLYSPKSLYLHGVYESFNQNMYHELPQKKGKINHENIESGTYSTAKRYLQGLAVYSEKYNVGGKIDIYDRETKTLIERKTRIKQVHEGQKFQLYAQMFALEEIGYPVEHLRIHSLEDNKRYTIDLPTPADIARFEGVLTAMRGYNPLEYTEPAQHLCDISIYRHLSY